MPVSTLNDAKSQLWLNTTLATLIKKDTLEAQLKLFLIACQVNNLSPYTIDDYARKVGFFVVFCRQNNVTDAKQITVDAVRLYILSLQQHLKSVSVHDYYGCIKRFLNWLVEESILSENPMARLRPPRVPKRVIQPFSTEQIKKMLMVCNDRFVGCRDRAIVLMFLDTGLRLSELANIMLNDIDLQKGIIMVMGKGAKQRLVRIGKDTQKAILKYMLQRNDDYGCLWVTEERRPLRLNGVKAIIRSLGNRAGITKEVRCSAHTFRHTFAIQVLRNGMGEFNLQSLLGHSSLSMTRHYVESLSVADALRAHEKASPVDNMRL
jgi:integrase/recombinase XerC/integrase/recombinase XerD